MKIGNYLINGLSDPYIIAEAGVNHNGSYDLAVRLVDEAANAGVQAIKWQIYKADTLCVRNSPRFWDWGGEVIKDGTQFDSYSKLDKFPIEDHRKLAKYCKEKRIEYLATPFDEKAVDFLETIDVSAYKIASCDCTNIPFIKIIASTQKTIILSTGASTIGEIEQAVNAIEGVGNSNIILLHCILTYPTDPKDANLKMISTLKLLFPKYVIGFSDHTLGTAVAIASVAFGAEVIEKHYTVDKTLQLSADHWLSVDPKELKELVEGAAKVKKAIGNNWVRPINSEKPAMMNARRSVVSKVDIPKGTVITGNMITCKRPGTGLEPKYLEILIGAKSKHKIEKDTLVKLSDFDLQ
jgi:sialic acid synthase SpsE